MNRIRIRIRIATGRRPLVGPVVEEEGIRGFWYAWSVREEPQWAAFPGQGGRGGYSYSHGGRDYRALVDAMEA